MDAHNGDDDEEHRRMLIDSIPRFEDIEKQKENVFPLRQGRRAVALSALLDASTADRDHYLDEMHQEFSRELESIDEVDDPLDIYIRYIRWTLEMYPQGHNQESNLVGLLKEATSRFQDDEGYRSDIRYLQIWLQYTKWVEDPKEIFVFLMKKDIGQLWAIFYEEYATYFERQDRYQDASEVFNLGIQRQARPVERLKRIRDKFTARVDERRERGLVNEEDHTRAQMQALELTGRTMLGHKAHSSAHSSVAANVFHGTTRAPPTLFGNATPKSPAPQNSRFSVFVEAESRPSHVSTVQATTNSTPAPCQRQQENEREITTFAGTTLAQKHHPRQQAPKFDVFRDEATNDEAMPSDTTETLLLKEPEGVHTAAELRRNPLLDVSSLSSVPYLRRSPQQNQAVLESWFDQHKDQWIQSKDSAGHREYIAASKTCLEGKLAPFSFEELRAQSFTAKSDEDPGTPPPSAGFDFEPRRPYASSPTVELTAETKAAMESIGALFSRNRKGKGRATETIDEQEEGLDWDQLEPTPKTFHHNENIDESVPSHPSSDRRDRIPFMAVRDVSPSFPEAGRDPDAQQDERLLNLSTSFMPSPATTSTTHSLSPNVPSKRSFDVFQDT